MDLLELHSLKPIVPMEPVRSETIPQTGAWRVQIKWDGIRILTYFDGQNVRMFNRKLNERTLHYPEIADIRSYCRADSVILDGEVIALGADGRPSFHQVMRRDGLRRMNKVPRVRKEVPVTYMIFDIVYYNGEWIHRRTLSERSEILSRIIKPNSHIQQVLSHDDAAALFAVMQEHGMEGIVMKKADSPYLIGEKKNYWLKIKNYRDLVAVIGGFTVREGRVNALLLGQYDGQAGLRYIGHAGTAKFTHREWMELEGRLRAMIEHECPFSNKPKKTSSTYWTSSRITVKIQFAEWTEDGTLRQPSIQGIVDVPPEECMLGE